MTGLAAKAATSTVPIVSIGSDQDRLGLVASFNRPGGNVTGVSLMSLTLTAKRLELLRELLSADTIFGILVNPNNPAIDIETSELQAAADVIRQPIRIMKATSDRQIHEVFANLVPQRIGGLVIGSDAFFDSRRDLLVMLAAQHRVPTIYGYAAAGGLISYAPSVPEAYRQAGIYVGRILKGEKPADLPVLQPPSSS